MITKFTSLIKVRKAAIGIFSLLLVCAPFENVANAQTACKGYNHCSSSFDRLVGPDDGYGPVTKAYCGQSGSSCCDCSVTKSNLQKYMDIHRKGGNGQPSYLFKTYWDDTVNPGLQAFLSKISQTIVTQSATRGGFYTAQDNIRSRGALQEGAAAAARNYLPSEQLCRYGSLSQGLGASDIKRQAAQIQIAAQGLRRSSGARGTSGQAGSATDTKLRLDEFLKEYCDAEIEGMAQMCGADSQRRFPNVPKDQRYNRDVNYTRTFDTDATLPIDFLTKKEDADPAEQDIMALGSNLYGSTQMSRRVTKTAISNLSDQNNFMQTRTVTANRGVAQNTYAAIAAMKAQGSGGSKAFMKNLFVELGMDAAAADSALGTNPSYYAQMDVLTKKAYQDPVFYVNLMEGKTNVARQSGALEGIELMQDRDMYQSMRRSEMLLATMIQLQTRKLLKDTAEDVKTK